LQNYTKVLNLSWKPDSFLGVSLQRKQKWGSDWSILNAFTRKKAITDVLWKGKGRKSCAASFFSLFLQRFLWIANHPSIDLLT